METQKIVNLLNGSDNENSKFATRKWYIIDNESKGNYSHENPIKLVTKSIESTLCDYYDAYILVIGDITATPNDAITQVVFKNCAPFFFFFLSGIVHHLKTVEQKLMIFLLIMQISLTLQCTCII